MKGFYMKGSIYTCCHGIIDSITLVLRHSCLQNLYRDLWPIAVRWGQIIRPSGEMLLMHLCPLSKHTLQTAPVNAVGNHGESISYCLSTPSSQVCDIIIRVTFTGIQ